MKQIDLERELVNRYQGGFPLQARPFKIISERMGCDEQEVLQAVKSMLDMGMLSRFGPLYDAVQIGGGLTLAALSVPQQRFAEVTELVNSLPQVAHNYQREHQLNMWFVLATESEAEIETVLQQITRLTGLKVYNFPKQREFYIGLWLHISASGRVQTVPVPAQPEVITQPLQLDSLDRQIIQLSQAGLPLVEDPWQTMAQSIGCECAELLQRLQRMLDHAVIRRIGLVPNHYRMGLQANGMTVWDVDDEHALEVGERIGQLDFVSHCYLRPRHLPLWRYNLFAMVHGGSRDAVYEKTAAIKAYLGEYCADSNILFSSAILKKTGIRLAA